MFLILLGKVSNYYSNNKVIRSIKAPTLHFLMQSGQLWCVFRNFIRKQRLKNVNFFIHIALVDTQVAE